MFICSCVGMYICKLLPCCVYAGSSMEFQSFEIQIKTEADSDECPQDNKPCTGMFAVSDEQDFVLCTTYMVLMNTSFATMSRH